MNDQLKSFVERIETLEEEKRERQEDIKNVYTEAHDEGFDKKILRKVVAARRKPKAERETEETLVDTYLRELGDL